MSEPTICTLITDPCGAIPAHYHVEGVDGVVTERLVETFGWDEAVAVLKQHMALRAEKEMAEGEILTGIHERAEGDAGQP